MKTKKHTGTEVRAFDKQYKVIAVLLFFFAILLLLALISYTVKDEENARVSIGELFGLLSGDPIIEAKAATTRNWLGLFGAWISYILFNKTVGFSFILFPLFIIAWSRYLFNGKKVSDSLLKNTTIFLILTLLFSGLMGSINTIDTFSDISTEWSGSIGQFLASIFTGLLSNSGSIILFISLILITIYLGSDIKLKVIFNNLSEKIKSIKFFKNDSSNKEVNTEYKDEVSKPDLSTKVNETNSRKKVNIEEVKPEPQDENVANNIVDEDFEPARAIPRKPTIIINKNIPKINQQNTSSPFAIKNESELSETSEVVNEPDSTEIIENNDTPTVKEIEIPAFKPNFKNVKEEAFTSLDAVEDELEESIISSEEIDTDTKNDVEIDEEIKPLVRTIELPKKEVIIPELDAPKLLNVTLNQSVYKEKEPVYLIGSSILDEDINYKTPGMDLLVNEISHSFVEDAELTMNAQILQEKLETFKIYIENLSVTPGPVVTQYEFVPAAGIKISKIESLSDDLAMALKAKGIRIIAPIPGKGTIGVEIPNANPAIVRFAETVDSAKFRNSDAKLPLVLGKTISGEIHIVDLAKMPHLLIAGSTGSGKSVGINTIIASLVYKMHPSELKFVIIDPKKVELQSYSKLKNHFMAASPEVQDTIVTKPEDAVTVLKAAVAEMELRYDILASVRQRNIADYNQKVRQGAYKEINDMVHKPMPYIVVIIDELADLMLTASKEIEEPITRLAQMARAIGIHLVVATQRPSVDVITGIIKANFPARIAYLVASKIDSRTILDMQGAEQLLGQGDMLCLPPGQPKPVRIQNSFISTDEVENICEFIGEQKGYSEPYYLPSLIEKNDNTNLYDPSSRDPLFEEAARLMIRHQQGSVSLIQRRLKVGYARAGRIVDELENAGVLGPFDGSKARLVLMESEADLERIL